MQKKDCSGEVKMVIEEGTGGSMLGFCHDQELDQCLQEVDEVRKSILSSGYNKKLERGSHRELDLVMVRLERQFRRILVSLPSISANDDSSIDSNFSSERTSFRISFSEACTSLLPVDDDDIVEDLHDFQIGSSGIIISLAPPPESINYLHRMAEQMVSSGYTQECIQTYSIVRRAAVDTNVLNLGLERMTIGDIQMLESDGLDEKVRKWIAVAKMCVRELFVAEKRLFEQIFEGSASPSPISTPTKYISFIQRVISPTMQLLVSFPLAVSRSRRFPEKLFSILDLYSALSHLLPEIERIFKPGGWELIAAEAEGTVSRLANTAGFILLEFENTLLREISTVVNPGGDIHTIARYVMKYMKSMLAFKQDFSKMVIPQPASLESVVSGDLIKDFFEIGGKSGLTLHFNWIATVLQFKLEEKSKLYENPSLGHLFMMNNIFYMCKNIGNSTELREMIGDDYFKKLTEKFRQAATNYQRSTWVEVLNCLRSEGLYVNPGFSSGVVYKKSVLRKKIKTFTAMFEEVCKTQNTWLVPDIHLREELRIDIIQKLILAYCYFCKRFGSYIENDKQPKKYIKHSTEDLEAAVLDLFEPRSGASTGTTF